MKTLDSQWTENLNKLEGELGLDVLPNDNPDLLNRLIKALKDRGRLPVDMDNPETMTEVEEVDKYANAIIKEAYEIAATAERMLVGPEVEKAYNNIMEGREETMSYRDNMIDLGLREDQF